MEDLLRSVVIRVNFCILMRRLVHDRLFYGGHVRVNCSHIDGTGVIGRCTHEGYFIAL